MRWKQHSEMCIRSNTGHQIARINGRDEVWFEAWSAGYYDPSAGAALEQTKQLLGRFNRLDEAKEACERDAQAQMEKS